MHSGACFTVKHITTSPSGPLLAPLLVPSPVDPAGKYKYHLPLVEKGVKKEA